MKFVKIALVLILTFTLTGCDQLKNYQTMPTVPPTVTTDPSLPTETRWAFVTSTPETTPTPKLIIPTFDPPSGWEKLEGQDFEIYLPGSYKGGVVDENVDQLVEAFHAMGAEYKSYADTLYQFPDQYKLMVVDSKRGAAGFITNLNIVAEPALPAYTIEAAMSTTSAALPQGYKIVDNDVIEINGHKAGQIVAEFTQSGIESKEIIYLIKGDSAVWIFTFATGEQEYNTRLVEFVQIVDSFRITSEME
jgi:hypothetical protein